MKTKAVARYDMSIPANTAKIGKKVVENFRTNATIFPNPPVPVDDLETEVNTLINLNNTNDGTPLHNQNLADQNTKVSNIIFKYLYYTNIVTNGDRAMILSSGFDCSKDRSSNSEIPDQVVIRRIEDGKTAHSLKIYVEPTPQARFYKVECADTVNADEWTTLNDHCNLYNITAEDLQRGKEIYIRVIAGNNNGWGLPSDPVAFIPR